MRTGQEGPSNPGQSPLLGGKPAALPDCSVPETASDRDRRSGGEAVASEAHPPPMPRILYVTAMPTGDHEIGGMRVRAVELLRQLRAREFEVDVLNSSRPETGRNILRPNAQGLAMIWRVLRGSLTKIWRCDAVLLRMSAQTAHVVASAFWLLCRVARKPLALDCVGGNWDEVYQESGRLARWSADRFYLRSELLLVETLHLVRTFRGPNVRRFPNTKDVRVPRVERPGARKLVFLGQLRLEKGLAEALEACRNLPEGCRLQVFGPRMPNTEMSLFDGHPRATYGGVLQPEDVPRVLNEHDVLVMPSYFSGEGHPGVIIEALQCGLPVIATRWRSIPELVQHEENGLLVEPRSSASLWAAIERLLQDAALYQRLSEGARRSGELHRPATAYDELALELRNLCRSGRIAAKANIAEDTLA